MLFAPCPRAPLCCAWEEVDTEVDAVAVIICVLTKDKGLALSLPQASMGVLCTFVHNGALSLLFKNEVCGS